GSCGWSRAPRQSTPGRPAKLAEPYREVSDQGGSVMTERTTVTEADVVTKLSHRSVADTAAKLTGLIDAKGMRLFALIDQREEAQRAGRDLRETILVIFGSTAAGTPEMAASPLVALDLPLKVLVWDDEGQTKVSYYAP